MLFRWCFWVDGGEDESEVGEEGGVEPVVLRGGLAVVLHAGEDALDDVPALCTSPCRSLMGPCGSPGRHDRDQSERFGRQAGRITLPGAVHEQVRAHERAKRGHQATPVDHVVLVARAEVNLDERRLAVGYHVNFSVPPSPGDPDALRPLFWGARDVLMYLHARGVHGEHPDLDGDDPLLLQRLEQALYRAVFGPAVEPLVRNGEKFRDRIGDTQLPPIMPDPTSSNKHDLHTQRKTRKTSIIKHRRKAAS